MEPLVHTLDLACDHHYPFGTGTARATGPRPGQTSWLRRESMRPSPLTAASAMGGGG